MSTFKLTSVVAAICLAGGVTNHAFAENSTVSQDKTVQLIKKINTRTVELENEVKKLRKQLTELKKTEKANLDKQSKENTSIQNKVKAIKHSKTSLLELGATPVISSPYIGVRSQFDGSDLIVNIPTYNQDAQLLIQQSKMLKTFDKKGMTVPETPMLEISGKIEGQVLGHRDFNGARSSDADLSGSEIDLTGHFAPWLTAFTALSYDNNAPNAGSVVGPTQTRTDNSRIYLDKAFVTFGNLSRTPFYATIGQRYHFGQYSSFMLSSPLTKSLARIKARSLLVGYQHQTKNGLYSTLYVFKGDTNVGNNHINQFGGTIGYECGNKNIKTDIGLDLVNNIADAQGMQNTGNKESNGLYRGFAYSSDFERLVKRVPGAALHAKFGFGNYSIIGEYVTALKEFDQSNLSYNGLGAKPSAFNMESAYMFNLMNKPANIAIGYGQTKNSLALDLPRSRLVTAFNVSLLKDTIFSLEYKRDKNYNTTDISSFQTLDSIVSMGGFTNTVTAQFGIYF
ncbi:MAG: hypothetical protein LEGION0398_MBIBDBAK_00362 [Legionellaceae bacterium]